MKKETIIADWKKRRGQTLVPDDFTRRVMSEIRATPPISAPESTEEFPVIAHRLMRWGTAAGLVIIGLFRITFIAVNLLRTSALIPY